MPSKGKSKHHSHAPPKRQCNGMPKREQRGGVGSSYSQPGVVTQAQPVSVHAGALHAAQDSAAHSLSQ